MSTAAELQSPFDTAALVVSMSATKEEIQLGQDRRDRIINFILEYFTGDQIDSKTLGHFRFIAEMFGLSGKVREMCGTSSMQGRQELAVTIALTALNVALDDTPPPPTQRQIDRKEARTATKQFEQRVASLKSAVAVKSPRPSRKRPLSQESSAVAHRKRRAQMTEEELVAFRALATQRQRERRARLKAAKDRFRTA